MRSLALLLLVVPAFAAPTITSEDCEVTSHSTIRCHWITDVVATTRIKIGTSTGVYTTTVDRPGSTVRTHSFQVSGLTAATLYYLVVCSTASGETCSGEMTATTDALPSPYPGLPVAPATVDSMAESAGSTLTVGSDCLDGTTGLQARINAAALGDIIVLPTTTINCAGQFTFPDKGAGTDPITLRCDSGASPAGTRTHPDYEPCGIYLTILNIAYSALITGTWSDLDDGNPCVVNTSTKPGTYVFQQSQATFRIRLAVEAVVTSDTGELYLPGGSTPRAGNAAYSSGGITRGLEWDEIVPEYEDSGPPSGPCTEDAWGHDTSVMYFDMGTYRCKADGTGWLKHEFLGSANLSQDGGNGQARQAVFVFENDSHHWRIEGIELIPPPFTYDDEFVIGPRAIGNTATTYGSTIGGIAEFGQRTHHIEFDRILMVLDPTKWTMHTAVGDNSFNRKPEHFTFKNYYLSGIGVWTQARHFGFENERQATGFDLTGGNGPFLIDNGFCEVYGFCLYFQEDGGMGGMVGNLTFTRNHVYKDLQYMDGGAAYATAGHTGKWWGRQAFEFKNGQRAIIRGNTFENQWVDQSRAAAFIGVGSQYGTTGGPGGTWSSGTYTTYENRPPFEDLEVGDTVMDLTNSAIYTIDDVSGLPSSFHVSGSPPDGTASICHAKGNNYGVRDVDISENVFKNGPISIVSFGNPYAGYTATCYPVPHQRIVARDNLSLLTDTLISATGAGAGGAGPSAVSPWLLSEGQEITGSHNSMYPIADSANGIHAIQFSEDDTEEQAWDFDGFVMKDSIFGFGTLSAIWRHGSTTGTAALDAQYPSSYTVTPNVFMRAAGDPGTYPASNYWETTWGAVGYNNAGGTDLEDYILTAGDHRAGQAEDASDNLDMGADIAVLIEHRGRITINSVTPTTTGALLNYSVENGSDQCVVRVATDQLDSGSGTTRTPTVSGLEPETMYDGIVACPTDFETFMFTTNALPIGERVRFSGGVRATGGVR